MTTFAYDGSDLTLEQLSSKLTEEVTLLRQTTLDKFTRQSPGVSRVYAENITAAQRYKAGNVSLMANNMTPTEYLGGLGAKVGMHASQFADYILYENQRLGAVAYEVEAKYLEGKTLFATSQDGDVMIAWMFAYRDYCTSVQGA
jgi:hypothetical protein